MVEAAGAEPAGRTSYLETILVNGEATGAPDERVAGGAVPPTRPKCPRRQAAITSGREALNPNGEGADF
jgi:hypothetical protein